MFGAFIWKQLEKQVNVQGDYLKQQDKFNKGVVEAYEALIEPMDKVLDLIQELSEKIVQQSDRIASLEKRFEQMDSKVNRSDTSGLNVMYGLPL